MNIRTQSQRDTREIISQRSFLAEVTDTSGGLVQIQKIGALLPDPPFYPATIGLAAASSPGDVVYCVETSGQIIVLARIATS